MKWLLALPIHLNNAVAIGAADERVAISQPNGRERPIALGAAAVVGTASCCEPAAEHEDATSSHASNVPVHALRPIRRS